MNKIYFVALATFMIFSYTSCKKYEDGPLISLKSKKNRLLGVWKVVEFMKDTEDLTKYYQDTCGCDVEFAFKQNKLDGGKEYLFILWCELNNWNYGSVYWPSIWDFSKDKTKIWLSLGYNNNTSYRQGMYPLTICPKCWSFLEIHRLTDKDLWVKYEDFDNIYTIKFEKK